MAIFLTVLKWIGIILLICLGLILFVLLTALFVPVHYRIQGDYHEKFTSKGKAFWMFPAIYVRFSFWNGKPELIARIFGKMVFPPKTSSNQKSDTSLKRVKKERENKDVPLQKEKNKTIPELKTESLTQSHKEVCKTPKKEKLLPVKKKKSILKDFFKNIKKFCIEKIRKSQYTFQRLCDKIASNHQKLNNYIEFFQKEETKESIRIIMGQLKKLVRHCRPRKSHVSIHFGMEDPSLTGEILGIYSIFYPYIGKNVKVYADFEQSIIEGSFDFIGRIQIFVLIRIAIKLYFSRECRHLWDKFLKEDKENVRE